MQPTTKDAIRILKKDGPVTFAKKTLRYLGSQTPQGDRYLYRRSLKDIRRRMQVENDLTDVLDTVLNIEPGYPPYQISAMQLREEIRKLTEILDNQNPKNILEIGTAKGGTLYVWNRYLESINEFISLDLPGGRFGGGYNKKKTNIFREFSESTEMKFIRDDSHKSETFETVSKLAGDGIDFLFIDGDHTYQGVKQDFEMYSQLVSEGGIIAFHDIVNFPDDPSVIEKRRNDIDELEDSHLLWTEPHPECEVDEFWKEIAPEYDTEELISHPKQTWAGIGVVRL